jgi:predicted nucleic acid-binding protein
MSTVAVLDACVLYPAALRDLLIRLAVAGAFQARWSERILDEAFDSLAEDRPGLDPARLLRTRALMTRVLAEAMVHPSEPKASVADLPDADDRHVVVTALSGTASVIVTFNLRDFPDAVLAPLGLRGVHPDDVVLDCLGRAPHVVRKVLHEQAGQLTRPACSVSQLLDHLERAGLVKFAAACRSGDAPGP